MKKKDFNLLSLQDFCDTCTPSLRLEQMRGYIAKRKKNGADMWIRRIGRRIYVDVDKFFEWTKRK